MHKDSAINNAEKALIRAISNATVADNPLAALDRAARLAADTPGPVITVISNGLSDQASPDLRNAPAATVPVAEGITARTAPGASPGKTSMDVFWPPA